MKRIIASLALLICVCASVAAQVSSQNARRLYSGTAVPTWPCSPGGSYTDFYLRVSTDTLYFCSAAPSTWSVFGVAGGGGAAWGSITGTLADQTDLQNALNLKSPLASPTFTGTVTIPTPFTLGAVSVTPTGTELNFVDGVTSAIQTQLDAKVPLAGGTLTGGLNFSVTNTLDIGTSATVLAPRTVYAGTSVVAPVLTATTGVGLANGTQGAPAVFFTGDTNTGITLVQADAVDLVGAGASVLRAFNGATDGVALRSDGQYVWNSTNLSSALVPDTGFSRPSAGLIEVNNGTTGTLRDITARDHKGVTFSTATNCSDSAGAASCGSAAAGSVVIDAGASSVVVSSTAVTANSQILVTFDSSLGTRLGVTCNTTAAIPFVSARTAATSFTISIAVAPITDPGCFSYSIIN